MVEVVVVLVVVVEVVLDVVVTTGFFFFLLPRSKLTPYSRFMNVNFDIRVTKKP